MVRVIGRSGALTIAFFLCSLINIGRTSGDAGSQARSGRPKRADTARRQLPETSLVSILSQIADLCARSWRRSTVSTLVSSVLVSVFLASAGAAQDVKPLWQTATQGGPAFSSSPTGACAIQHQAFASTAPFQGANPRDEESWACRWCAKHHDVSCPVVSLPSIVTLRCLNPDLTTAAFYSVVSPGKCEEPAYIVPAQDFCGADNGASNGGKTEGNPVVVATGTKVERAKDFETADGLFNLSRTYRSDQGAFKQIWVPNHGLGVSWRFNFAWDLKLSDIFPHAARPNFTVVKPNGASFDFKMDPSGAITKLGYTLDGLTVTLVTSITDLNDIINNGATFKVVDQNDVEITIELYNVGTGDYRTGRVTQIKQPSGYTWTFAYTQTNELATITDTFNRQFTFTWLKFAYAGEAAATARAVTSVQLPDGTSLHYTYSATDAAVPAGQVYERIDKVERKDSGGVVVDSTTYHYEDADLPFMLTGITDHKNVRYATFAYNSIGRAILTEHHGGADRTTFSYEKVGSEFHHKVTNALGKVTNYVYEQAYMGGGVFLLRLKRVDGEASANCLAGQKSFTHSGVRVLTSTDEEGRVTTYVRDTVGRPTKITRATGTPEEHVTDIVWSATHNKQTQIAEPLLTHDMVYNATGALTQYTQTDTTTHTVPYSTNGQTRIWAFTYTTEGLLDTVDGPLPGTGDIVDYDYDADGYLDQVTNEVGHVTDIVTVNSRGQPTKIRDGNSVDTDLGYDAVGRLETVTVDPGPNQAVTTLVYDAIGQITKITRPDGSSFDMAYSDARRLTSISSGDGEKIEFDHDAAGNVTKREVKASDATLVFTQTQTFDELSRLLTRIGANTQTTTFGYDKVDNLKTITDPRSNVYSFAYDALNRLIKETDQDLSEVDYTLDDQGNITTYEDPRNLQTTYVRNGFGEAIRRTSPDTGITDYVYNAQGLITQMTDARSVVTDYTYDALGRVLTKSFPASAAENVTLTYDDVAGGNKGVGQLTGIADQSGSTALTWDVRGNVTSDARTIGLQSYTVAYDHDAADRMSEITYPSGRTVTYVRDVEGRITSVSTKEDALATPVGLASNITYLPLTSVVKTLNYGNGLDIANTFTQDYEIDVLGVYDGVTAIISRTHGRTDKLNLTGITDGVTAADSQTFAYTPSNRLEDADGPWGNIDATYDGVGNRLTRALTNGGPTVTQTFGYPAGSNLIADETTDAAITRTFTHDAAGNMTKDVRGATTYDYVINHAGRISELKIDTVSSGTYTYNAQNQLVIRSTSVAGGPSGAVHYVYNRRGLLLAEIDGATGNSTREYIWLGDMPLAVVADVDTASPVIYYVHVDHLNRPIMMTAGNKANVWQATWLPWGGVHAITGAASLDARLPGQWFQIETGLHYNWHRHYDPTLARYTQADHFGFVDGPSLYAYGANSPHMYVDPSGEFVHALAGAALFGLADLGLQLWLNGGRLECVRWWEVGTAAAMGALPGAWLSGAFRHSVRNVSWWKSGSKLWKNASRRIRRAQNTPATRDLHHWAIPQRSWLAKKFPGIFNHPWNLNPVPSRFNQVTLEAMGPLQRLIAGSPGWARVLGGSLGSGVAASAITSANSGACECGN